MGTPGALVAARSWDDYSIGRAPDGSLVTEATRTEKAAARGRR